MAHDGWLAVLAVAEHGWLADAVLRAQTLAQQQIGRGTLAPPLLMAVAQHLLATLLRQQRQDGRKVQLVYMVVDV